MCPPPQITGILLAKGKPQQASIKVAGKTEATLPVKIIEDLDLQVGQAWEEVCDRVEEAVTQAKAQRQAMRYLNRRAVSRAELADRLVARGYDSHVTQYVLDRLEELGVINDKALGETLIEQSQAKRPAGPALLRVKLLRRGLDETLVDELVKVSTPRDVELSSASAVVRQRLHFMTRLNPMTRKRRLWGLLARRGFDHETIEQVLAAESDPGEIDVGDSASSEDSNAHRDS